MPFLGHFGCQCVGNSHCLTLLSAWARKIREERAKREFSLKETGQTFTLRCLAHRAGFGDGECGFAGGCNMRFKRVICANLDGLKLGHDRRKDFLLSKVSSG